MRATVLCKLNVAGLLGRLPPVRTLPNTVRPTLHKPIALTGLSRLTGSSRMVMSSTGGLEQLPPAPLLQRDLFCETLHLKALRIPKKDCNKFRKLLSG